MNRSTSSCSITSDPGSFSTTLRSIYSSLIAERCFVVMETGLRFNICGLESSFVPDREVEDIEGRIKEKISPTLAYACRYWAKHLELAARCDRLTQRLEKFLSVRLLFWMEVLNLKQEMRAGVIGLMKAEQWTKLTSSASPELMKLVEDAHDFVSSYGMSPMSESTPHIYISALPFCPRSSRVYRCYSKRMTGLLDLKGSAMRCRESAALTVWNGGSDPVYATYSLDASRIAFGGYEGTACIRDAYGGGQLNAADGTPIASPFRGHTKPVRSLSFSPDGALIASGSGDPTVRIWRVDDGMDAMSSLEACSDTPVVFSPSGSHIAATSADYNVLLWNMRANPPSLTVFKGHAFRVMSIAFPPDGSRVVSGSWDSTIRVWNASDGTLMRELIGHVKPVTSVTVSPDGKRVISGSDDGTIRVWDINDGTVVVGPFVGHVGAVTSVACSPDGTRVLSAGSSDHRILIRGVRDHLTPSLQDSQMFEITSMMFSLTESHIYTTSPHGTTPWGPSDGSLTANLTLGRPHSTFSMPLSSDGASIAVFLEDHSVEVVSTEDGSRIAGPFYGHTNSVESAAFSADGVHLVTGSMDLTVRVSSLKDGSLTAGPFVGHTNTVHHVSISSDGSQMLSCSLHDKSIRL
ncbi:unnamed protein product [Rhizoctonia solani]|uniref:Vegetative incompatibility protein HET-E-1 n=1 Tax=Rhizoctonia solani TaxID=456999 RepID=A0A8H3C223_9AGAM|nr:unnamed protein product [Rhizoctonia solani]